MAFLPPEQQNQNAPQGQTSAMTGAPPPQTGGSSGAGTTGAKPATSTQGTPTQFGSSASKLSDYLSANAPQIGQQANTVTNNLNQQYGQIQGDITNAANQFGQSVQGGYAAPNQDIVNQAIQNPTQFVTNPQNVAGFQAQYNDQYTGPQNFESTSPYAGIQNEVSQAVQNAGLLGTQAGLTGYLAGQGGPNATKASNTLDALLLQGNPQAQAQIQTAAGQFQNLTPQFNTAVTNADQSVQAAQQAAQQAQQYAQGQFNPFVQQFGQGLTNATNTAETQRTAYNQNQQNAYNQLTPIQQYLQGYLGNSGVTMETNPLDPYLSAIPVTNPITVQNYSTPEQYQEAAAIQQLLGGNASLPINATTTNQAGTAPQIPNLPTYNLQNLVQNLATQAYQDTNQQGKFLNGRVDTNIPWETLLGELQQYDPYQNGTGIGTAPGVSGPISLYGNLG